MKKLIGIIILAGVAVFAANNFYGHQSLNGLNEANLFAAPLTPTTSYFINGQLKLPLQSQTGDSSGSRVIAIVYKDNVQIYRGATGATGFQIRAVRLTQDQVIKVGLTSASSVDSGLNKVRGDVFFGNSF